MITRLISAGLSKPTETQFVKLGHPPSFCFSL